MLEQAGGARLKAVRRDGPGPAQGSSVQPTMIDYIAKVYSDRLL